MPLAHTRARVFAFSLATGEPVLGIAENITAKWAKDYAVSEPLTDLNPVETEFGFYYFELSAAERDVALIGEIYPESDVVGVQVIGVPAYFMLTPGLPLTGPYTRTLTVLDSVSALPIQNATVRFFREGKSESKLTDSNGVAAFNVDGSVGGIIWNYVIVASGYVGVGGEVTVSDTGDTPITMVANPSPPPLDDIMLCNCTVTAINQHGDPAADASVVAMSKNIGADDDRIFVFNEDREYWTDAGGQTALPLLRGHRYAITVTFGDFGTRTVLRTIPDAATFHILVKL